MTIIIIAFALLIFSFTDIGGKSIERIKDVLVFIVSDTSNFVEELRYLDSSVHARVAPTFVYLTETDWLSYKTYFGHGASASEAYFSKVIYPEKWNTHMVFRPPFVPGFLYDYGFFGATLVLIFLYDCIKGKGLFFKGVFIILIINANFNTQLFWFVVTLLSISKITQANLKRSNALNIPTI
ncbi:hypothetical protein Q2T40_18850 [Winogradskyella maritima]|nr:hypothetical protein [Winogradskyella maritima]